MYNIVFFYLVNFKITQVKLGAQRRNSGQDMTSRPSHS